MNPFSVLVKPIISEKSNWLREKKVAQYVFEVAVDANKTDISKAVEKVFGVKTSKVQTAVCRGKLKRRGTHLSKQKTTKKAVVTLVEGQKLNLFEDQ